MNTYSPILDGNIEKLHPYSPGLDRRCKYCGVPQSEHSCPYYYLVPLDLRRNAEFRRKLMNDGLRDAGRAAAIREMCRRDMLFWIASSLWIFEPKKALDLVFIPWPFQEEMLLCLESSLGNHDLVIEKTRETAASWSAVAVYAHKWQFHGRQTFLVMSRKEDLVDRTNDSDSLFWKFDYLMKRQPSFIRPKRYDENRTKMNAFHEATGASMTGESTNEFAGVGGRKRGLLLDEFSKMKNGDAILTGTRDVTLSRWFIFTPQGSGHPSYRIAHNPKFRKLSVHWSVHPLKRQGLYRVLEDGGIEIIDQAWHDANPGYEFRRQRPDNPKYDFRSPWYDGECDRANHPKEIPQELDIDYLGSQYTYYNARDIEELIRETAISPYYVGELKFDHDGRPLRFLEDDKGRLRLWIHPNADGTMPDDRPYALGVDIAEGTGASNSAITVADCLSGEKVAEYANPFIEPHDLARYARALALWFGGVEEDGCKIIWEAAGPGVSFRKALLAMGYFNVYWRKQNEKKAFSSDSQVPGWWPTTDNKKEAHADYKRALGSGRFLNRSELALRETLQYVWTPSGEVLHVEEADNIDPTGAGAQHGDRVVADMLCCKIVLEYDAGTMPSPAAIPSPSTLAGRKALAEMEDDETYEY